MDLKTRLLISLGAATAADCIPCFEHYYGKANTLKLTSEEIQAAVDIAVKVKNGAQAAMKNSINTIMESEPEAERSCCEEGETSCCG